MGTSMLYSKKFLMEDNNNAATFLKSIAYDVKMKSKCLERVLNMLIDLIRVVKTCHYHQMMPYCPVILEIKNPELKEIIKGNFIL